MTPSATVASGPRYAPEDPTLPKPWKGLVDGSTGYLYYWNPSTNVTQYERPAAEEQLPPPPPLPKLAPLSSVQIHQHHREEDGRSRSHQQQGVRVSGARSGHGSGDAGHGSSGPHSHVHGSVHSRMSTRNHGSSNAGFSLSAEAYRRQNEITVTGDDIPAPFVTFESTGFPPEILKEVQRAGFSCPTPIQAQSWPIALQGSDVVAIAKTGSGKTIGYLFPGFVHLKRVHNNSKMGPTVLVLSPTRELATQIQDEAVKFGRSSRISCTCLYGGAPKGPQLRDLDRGVDIVVATPGRLNDILEMRRVSLRQVSYLVLDEADRMLDMGFEPQIRKIVNEVPHRRQTLMFTATWPKEVRKIAADLLVNPIQVNIGSIDELVANNAITQYVELIRPLEKQKRLEQILRSQETGSKIIIFCTTKRMCDQLARSLIRQFGAAAIHGDKSQMERDRVLNQFKTGRSPILVATDVAARGLDIKDIRVVINYDFPTGVEDYVHRIGRTGRAGATGISYTFFSEHDSKYALELVKVLEGADQRVPPELRDMAGRAGYGGKSRRWASGSSARDRGRGRLGAGRSDSANVGRSHVLSTSSIAGTDHDHSDYGRDTHVRYNRMDGYALDKRVDNGAKGNLRGRSHSRSPNPSPSPSPRRGKGNLRSRSVSPSPSPSPKRLRGMLGNGRSRSRSRSRSQSDSRNGSHSLGRNNGRLHAANPGRRLSPPKRKDFSVDYHHAVQSPPRKRRETSNERQRGSPPRLKGEISIDRHRGPSPSPKKEISIDRHRGPSPTKREILIDRGRRPSPRSKRENSIGHHQKASPPSNSRNSADDSNRASSLPKNESVVAEGRANDSRFLASRVESSSPPRRRSQSPPHLLVSEAESNRRSGIESGNLLDEPVRQMASAPANGYGEEEEEGLIPPDEEEGLIPPEPIDSRDN